MAAAVRALGAPPPTAARQRTAAAAPCSALAVPGPPARRPWGAAASRGAPHPAAGAAAGRRTGARGRTLRVSASYSPYPWNERDYYRVALQMVQVGTRATHGPLLACRCLLLPPTRLVHT